MGPAWRRVGLADFMSAGIGNKNGLIHGKTGTTEHIIWCQMRYRCNNPNSKDYPFYGGRGIYIDPTWDSFEQFLADMGLRPSKKHTIDRKDNDGPYSKENCRWATQSDQRRNSRSGRLLTLQGTTLNLVDWAHRLGINPTVLDKRLKRGWSIDRHDEIFQWGSDRNGLSHTVSYDRAKQLDASLGGRHRIVLNGAADPESSTAQDAFKRFTGSTKPSVLVSPSFAVGWDFSGTHAEWQVISKIAFPPRNSKIIQSRTESDPEYPAYIAAQDLVQACGRITRYPQDRGMTLIVDDAVSKPWFKHALKEYAPRWFNIRKEEQLPRPLEKL